MAAKTNRRRAKRNPKGATLVNPRGKRAAKKTVPLSALFKAAGGLRKNGAKKRRRTNARKNTSTRTNRRKATRGRRKNPLMVRTNRRRSTKRKNTRARRRNPLMVRTNRRRGGRRRNPLMVRTNRRHSTRRRRRNPLMVRTNRRRRVRRNPSGLLGMISRIPVIGPVLAQAAASLGGAAFGAVASVPHYFIGKYVGPKVPSLLKPVQYSLYGAVTSAILAKVLPNFRYKNELVLSIAVAGGTIDGWRALNAKMGALAGDEYDGDGYDGDSDIDGDDDGYGVEENVRPGEYGDADLMDAEYSGDDLSADEMEWAGYGRAAYRKRYMRKGGKSQGGEDSRHQGGSEHAGKPGVRWGWLIYWIGFDQFKVLAKLPENQRKQVIHRARHAALQAARQAVQVLPDTTVSTAETAGLLAME